MNKKDFPELFQLLAGYFHQDWYLDDEDPDAVLLRYLREESVEAIRQAAEEVSRLLGTISDEQHLRVFVISDLGSYYDPSADSLSMREWLGSVKSRLESAVKE